MNIQTTKFEKKIDKTACHFVYTQEMYSISLFFLCKVKRENPINVSFYNLTINGKLKFEIQKCLNQNYKTIFMYQVWNTVYFRMGDRSILSFE